MWNWKTPDCPTRVETELQSEAMAGWAQDAGRSEGLAVMARIEAKVSTNMASATERVADVQQVVDGENAGAEA